MKTPIRFGERLRQERFRRHLSQEALAEILGISPKSISRWEQDQAVPQAHYRLQLSRFFGLLPEELFENLEAQIPSSFIWTVPFPRNPYFTGRESILEAVHTLLAADQPVALTQAFALTGLGGIGKTQVAIEYAYRYAPEYRTVFWLAAETTEDLMASLYQIAVLLHLPESQAAEQSQMVAAVQRWLAMHTEWLLIGDNVNDLEKLQKVLPPVRHGALLLTTRSQALGTLAEPLALPPMSYEEGVTLVLRRAKLLRVSAPDAALSQGMLQDISTSTEAEELVKLLEGLPLALDQAGAYIEETGCSVTEYLQRCHSQRKHVLARRGIHGGEHPASVTATLMLALEQIEKESQAAADLLRLCAFLHPEAIPEELFLTGRAYLGSVLETVVADAYQFDHALAVLRSVSLVTRQPEARTLSVHRLVQAVLQDEMEPADILLWSERVVRVVNAAFPVSRLETWAQCERCLSHALACVPLIASVGIILPEAGELFYKGSSYLMERGRYVEAEPLLDQALAQGEQYYGSDHPVLMPRLMKRAELYWRQGKYEPTEQLLLRLLALGEQQFGLEHLQIAETLANLASLYWDQGKYEEAESLYQRALSIQEQQLGAERPEVAETLNNLALIYYIQGKYELVEQLHQRALAIWEVQMGPDHPRTALNLNNLAALYRDQGKYEQSEVLYLRALRIQEQQLGSEHSETTLTLNGLATLYREQRRYEEAESLYQRALHGREQQLGPEHPKTAMTLTHLATLYREQGRYEEAESLYQRGLRIIEQQLGPEHPEAAFALVELATLYREQGRYEEAESLYQRGRTIIEQRLGSGHPRLVNIRNDYNCLLDRKSKAAAELKDEQLEPAQFVQEDTRPSGNFVEAEQIAPLQATDSLQDFLTACSELHPRAWTRASELWQAYERWVEERQERFPLSRRAFTAQLKARGYQADRINTARIWRGIAIIGKDT